MKIKLTDIDSFSNHPFKVIRDESFFNLVDSIKDNGLLVPITVRKKDILSYEVISGHRRLEVYKYLGYKEIECNVVEMNDDEATIYMVDSNMYRDEILPSEKAYAYKMKMDAMKHQGKKDSTQVVSKLRTGDKVGKIFNDSRENVRRYIRLTYLIPELLTLVDNTIIYDQRTHLMMGISIAVDISYLHIEEQKILYDVITYLDSTPSLGQAKKIRKLSKLKQINFKILENLLKEKKGNQNDTISFNKSKIEGVIPREILKRDKRYVERYIIEAIIQFSKNQMK